MRLVIEPVEGEFEPLELGSRGRELAGWIPDQIAWKQLNYGQGEGQVEILGREWGFYFGLAGEHHVQLEKGDILLEEAFGFATQVAKKIAKGVRYRISVRGSINEE